MPPSKSKNPAAVALGRLGGARTSKSKAAASRANGRLGGATGGRPAAAYTVAASKGGPTLKAFASEVEARDWIAEQDVVRKRTYWVRTTKGVAPVVVTAK